MDRCWPHLVRLDVGRSRLSMDRNEGIEVLVMPAFSNQTPKRIHKLMALLAILSLGQEPVARGEDAIPLGRSTQSVYAKIVLPMKTPDGNQPLVDREATSQTR